jgi:hypothetical protein
MLWHLQPLACIILGLACLAQAAAAVEHRVEAVDEKPPADGLSAAIVEQLSPSAVRVLRGKSTKVCDIWLARTWQAQQGFKPTNEVLYPFQPGQLMGVIRYARKGGDFRGQEIPAGLYTLRYSQQPVDGNHVGTSETRDFLSLVAAADDRDAQTIADEKALYKLSAKAAGSMHPAILALRRAEAGEAPSIRHLAEPDLWVLRVAGKTQGGAAEALPLELVVVGQAAE